MEISNLSSAWWLIAIVVLVIVTRVVLYYRAKAKRKDESSKRLSDKVNITREQLANISGKQFEAYVNMKPSFDLCSKSIDITQTKQEKPKQAVNKSSDENVKKLFCDLNGNRVNNSHVAPSGKVPDFTPPKPRPSYGLTKEKTRRISNNTGYAYMKKYSDDYNANSMHVLSSSYTAQENYSSNSSCGGSSSIDSGGSSGGSCD